MLSAKKVEARVKSATNLVKQRPQDILKKCLLNLQRNFSEAPDVDMTEANQFPPEWELSAKLSNNGDSKTPSWAFDTPYYKQYGVGMSYKLSKSNSVSSTSETGRVFDFVETVEYDSKYYQHFILSYSHTILYYILSI